MNAQEEFWSGSFGDDYITRNAVNWWARTPFWSSILARTLPRTVLEIGCNAGWNLMALRACWGEGMHASGIEINERAAKLARGAGFQVRVGSFSDAKAQEADLVFTSGVLIHVAPENLAAAMDSIINASRQYVLAIEYEHPWEEEVVYRGEKQRLWRRPFGKLYEKAGLRTVDYWQTVYGWDRCAAWLMERP